MPNIDGLIVIEVDRCPELVFWESVTAITDRLGQQLPGKRDRFFFEVVTEGKVASHLKERRMSSGFTHFFNVQGAHHLLHAGGTRIRSWRFTKEIRLERNHASVHKQQGWIIEQK